MTVLGDRRYPMGLKSVRRAEEMHFENTEFDGQLIVELSSAPGGDGT